MFPYLLGVDVESSHGSAKGVVKTMEFKMSTTFCCPNCGVTLSVTMEEEQEPVWTRHGDGWGWRLHADGVQLVGENPPQSEARLSHKEADDGPGYIYRSTGNPSSMLLCAEDFYYEISEASSRYGVKPEHIMACIAIEATRIGSSLHFDPSCYREESGFESDTATPHRISPGLMQTLISTANDMYPSFADLMSERSPLLREDLFIPRRSILSGTAYMRDRFEKYGDEILAYVAAYNAGSVQEEDNVWNLKTHSDTRIDRFMAWTNDAVSLGLSFVA